jgi:hypothetical protein
VLHPEEAWPRRWVQRRWALAALVGLIALIIGGALAAVVLAVGGDEAAQPAPAPPIVLPPESFDAQREGLLAVRLSWSRPTGGVKIDHYDVYRNGSKLITLSDVGTTYVDDNVRPGREYTYEIEARGTAGGKELTSERMSTTFTTPIPALKKARVAGDFSVKVKTLSYSGYDEYETPTYGWHIEPKCRTGACNVAWKDLHEKGIRAVLKQKGRRYTGSYSGFFFGFCGDTRGSSSVKIDLKVAKAKAIGGEWLATKLVGRVDQSAPAQLGCVSSRATQAVTAKLVR